MKTIHRNEVAKLEGDMRTITIEQAKDKSTVFSQISL